MIEKSIEFVILYIIFNIVYGIIGSLLLQDMIVLNALLPWMEANEPIICIKGLAVCSAGLVVLEDK